METRARGTFSFTLSAEWDYVTPYNAAHYRANPYSIPLDERLDMRRAVKYLLASGNWVPYSAVKDMSIERFLESSGPPETSAKTKNEHDGTHDPLFSEYLYFNSHMRRLIYNQENVSNPDNKADRRQYANKLVADGGPVVVLYHTRMKGGNYHLLRYNEQPSKSEALEKLSDRKDSREMMPELIEYILPITSVELRLYAIGVCLLTIRCQDEKPKDGLREDEIEIPYQYRTATKQKDGFFFGELAPVNDALHLAWIEGSGRRLFSARMCKPGEFGKMASEFPIMSFLRPCGEVAERSRKGPKKNKLEPDDGDIVICDFRSFLNTQQQAPASVDTDPWNTSGRLADEHDKEWKNHHKNWKKRNELKKQFVDTWVKQRLEQRQADLWKWLLGIDKQPNPSQSAQRLPAPTQPERFGFLSELIGKNCISKVGFGAIPPKVSRGMTADWLVLDCFNDDRMYLHGSIVSETIGKMTKAGWEHRSESAGRQALKSWYAILFADSDWNVPSCQDPDMLVSLIEQATDPRWLDFSTFQGITYHAIVLLTQNTPPDFLQANNDWHYLQMFLIAVLQRCGIQRFYREASGLLRTRPWRSSVLRTSVQNVYTLFLNQFWFFEVTEQEQGKHLFDRLQKAMNIERDVEFLDSALEEINQQNSNNLSNMVNRLLLPLSIIGGLWTVWEWWKTTYEAQQKPALINLIERVQSVLRGTPKPFPWLDIADYLIHTAVAIAFILCVGVYAWNQGVYLKHSCNGMLPDLRRRFRKRWRMLKDWLSGE